MVNESIQFIHLYYYDISNKKYGIWNKIYEMYFNKQKIHCSFFLDSIIFLTIPENLIFEFCLC